MEFSLCLPYASLYLREYLCYFVFVVLIGAPIRAIPENLQSLENAVCPLRRQASETFPGGFAFIIHMASICNPYKYVNSL